MISLASNYVGKAVQCARYRPFSVVLYAHHEGFLNYFPRDLIITSEPRHACQADHRHCTECGDSERFANRNASLQTSVCRLQIAHLSLVHTPREKCKSK